MTDLLTAIGLVIAIEGGLYALFPEAMKRFIAQAMEMPANTLRTSGLFAAIVGVFLVWLVRG
ncbi:MAG: DUF2065 domain-containing protein [Proteobacteria bacterium]|nr:DUF2065 domain-containing protein [Pseudomonadota bacterium]